MSAAPRFGMTIFDRWRYWHGFYIMTSSMTSARKSWKLGKFPWIDGHRALAAYAICFVIGLRIQSYHNMYKTDHQWAMCMLNISKPILVQCNLQSHVCVLYHGWRSTSLKSNIACCFGSGWLPGQSWWEQQRVTGLLPLCASSEPASRPTSQASEKTVKEGSGGNSVTNVICRVQLESMEQ